MVSGGMSTIEEIKSRCDIVDVIGRHVQLKKAGNNYKGLCPFHNEKTASFMVSGDKQIFTCFGCGASGDVIEFTKRYNNLDFQEAIEKLADEHGIELKNEGYGGEGKKTILYEMNREAATFFYRCFSKKPNKADDYMKARGFEGDILQKFGIGYADEDWQSLYNHLKNKGYDESNMLSLGLISVSGERYFDKFRDRIIFPIINTRGKIIGFGGRAIGDGTPKYLNSQESPIFQKKNNLYGLYLTRQDINREDCAILVEGYMDVISLYQHGVRNISASLGTALTDNQAGMLKRYTGNIVLAYDADEAGQAAALRGMDILYGAGCKVKVLTIPEGKDPDEFVKKNGKEAFSELLKRAVPFVDFKINKIKQRFDIGTTEGSVAFLKEAAEALKSLKPIESEAYIKKIAAEAGISEGAFRVEVFGESNRIAPQESKAREKTGTHSVGCSMLEQNLIRLMLIKSSYIPKVEPYKNVFETAACHRIFEIVRALYKPDEEVDIRQLKDCLDSEACVVLERIMDTVQFADRDSRVFEECIAHIKLGEKMKREEELIKILSVLDDEKDSDKILELTMELMQIQKGKVQGSVQ
ncbi:DNA primase [Bacillota bacterium]